MNTFFLQFFRNLFFIVFVSILCISCNKPYTDTYSRVLSPQPVAAALSASDSIATPNLIAYWPFENSADDVIGGEIGTAVNVTYTDGVKGKAYQGTNTSSVIVTANAAFANLQSYTLSFWYKLAAQPVLYHPEGMFFLSGDSDLAELIVEAEDYNPVSGDSVRIHAGFWDVASTDYQLFVMQAFDTMAVGKWVHLVATYDGSASVYTIYQDGAAILNQSVFGSYNATKIWTNNLETTPLGPLGFLTNLPSKVYIGAWPPTLFGVSPSLGANGSFNGALDEIRVYNKALNAQEVDSLYIYGKKGR